MTPSPALRSHDAGPPRERSSRLAGPRARAANASTTGRGARYSARGIILMGVIALASAFSGCGDRFDSCYARRNCAPGGQGGGAGDTLWGGDAGMSASGGENASGAAGIPGMPGGGAGGGGRASGDDGVGGAAGNAGAGGAGGSCDLTLSPSDAPCVATDAHALFVAPTGSDKAAGTQDAPLQSIGKALALAEASGKVVVVCNATYDEALSVTASVRLYGGFACPDDAVETPWTYLPDTRTVVAPSTEGLALEVRDVDGEVRIEDVEFSALDASVAGESSVAGGSSVAAVVEGSLAVTLRRVKIVAGEGAAGGDGESGEKGEDGAIVSGTQKGLNATCGADVGGSRMGGSWTNASTCGSAAGQGGFSVKGSDGTAGIAGNPRTNVTPPNIDNGGTKGATGGDGQPGSPGNTGTPGAALSDDSTFSALGFTPASAAESGTDGFPGQGGGGGGASNAAGMCIGSSGGAGGMGGCGGKAGTGGSGGGASVALISWNSSITLDACELVSSDGGAGGKGGDGGAGGLGKDGAEGGAAFTDATNTLGKGGHGGPGGDGGHGGPAAGGNGGPSYPLVVQGDAPTRDNDTHLLPDKGGARGAGGIAGGIQAQSGTPGPAAPQLTLP